MLIEVGVYDEASQTFGPVDYPQGPETMHLTTQDAGLYAVQCEAYCNADPHWREHEDFMQDVDAVMVTEDGESSVVRIAVYPGDLWWSEAGEWVDKARRLRWG